jgi:hypothetical protein
MTRSVCKFLFVLPAVALVRVTAGSATAWPQQQLDAGSAAVQNSPNRIQEPVTPTGQRKPKDIADEIRAKLEEIGPVGYSYRVPGGADSTHTLEQKLSASLDCKATYESTNTTVVAKSRTTTTTRVLNVDFALLQPSRVTVSEAPAPVEAPAECFSGACGGHWTLNIATNGSGIQCNPRSSTVVRVGTLTAEQNFGCYDDANGTWVHEPLVVHQINVWMPDDDTAKHIQKAFHDLIASCGGKEEQGAP